LKQSIYPPRKTLLVGQAERKEVAFESGYGNEKPQSITHSYSYNTTIDHKEGKNKRETESEQKEIRARQCPQNPSHHPLPEGRSHNKLLCFSAFCFST